MEEKYYSIGKVSKICNVPIKTLRYYDKIKVLVPEIRKDRSNYRYYSHNQMIKIFVIKQLRHLDFSLEEIRKILNESDFDRVQEIVENKRKSIEEEIRSLQNKYESSILLCQKISNSNHMIKEKGNGRISNSFAIEYQDEIYLYCHRKMMHSYKNENVNLENWINIIESAKHNNLEIKGDIYVSYHTEIFGQFISKNCEVEFGIVVGKSENTVKFGGFKSATALYIGDYSDIIHTYILLKRWIEEQGLSISGPVTERFFLSPIDIPNSETHIVKIIVPVS